MWWQMLFHDNMMTTNREVSWQWSTQFRTSLWTSISKKWQLSSRRPPTWSRITHSVYSYYSSRVVPAECGEIRRRRGSDSPFLTVGSVVFQEIHNLSHPSRRAMLAIIARGYVWQGMRREVLAWARECQVCARSKVARHTSPPVQAISPPVSRFEHIQVDVVGPFPTDQGMRYVFTMIDRTTRWPEAVAIIEATADTIIQAFHRTWIARFGIPRIVTSDRGAQFTSKAWTATMTRLGISQTTTTAYHPQSNGLVERFHRSLKNALRCAVTTTRSWTRSLPWVLLGLRNAPRSETATSAAEVLFGTTLRVPGLCFRQDVSPESSEARQLQLARDNVEKYLPPHLNHKKFRHSPFVQENLQDCTHVFVRNDSLAKPPLEPRYTGPFLVLEKRWDNNTFVLTVGGKKEVVSLGRLKSATMAS